MSLRIRGLEAYSVKITCGYTYFNWKKKQKKLVNTLPLTQSKIMTMQNLWRHDEYENHDMKICITEDEEIK